MVGQIGTSMFYVKWNNVADSGLPKSDTLCVTMRGSMKLIEYYHGDNVWSGTHGNPDYWATWKYPELIGGALSRERVELLNAIVSPEHEHIEEEEL